MQAFSFDQHTAIGEIIKTNGYKGHLLVNAYEDLEHTWSNLKKCLIQVNGIWAPFFIETMASRGEFIEIKFEEIPSDQEAQELIRHEICIHPEEIHPDDLQHTTQEESWIGYLIKDESGNNIGMVDQVEELPTQELAVLRVADKEIRIPIVEDFILDIDLENKVIVMNLPDGLLDLNV